MPFTGRRDFEDNFPHHNWLISIFVLLTVGYVGHIMFTPSIYQFVTTDRSPSSDDNEEVSIDTSEKYNSVAFPFILFPSAHAQGLYMTT